MKKAESEDDELGSMLDVEPEESEEEELNEECIAKRMKEIEEGKVIPADEFLANMKEPPMMGKTLEKFSEALNKTKSAVQPRDVLQEFITSLTEIVEKLIEETRKNTEDIEKIKRSFNNLLLEIKKTR